MSTGDGTSVNAAAQKLRGILSEQTQPTDSPQAPEEAAETSTAEAETPAGDTETNPRRVKAKLDDIDVEFEILTEGVNPELIPKGLMMESDYRKKTMSLAEERKALEAEKGKIAEKMSDLEAVLSIELDALNGEEGEELKKYDPEEYLKRVDAAQKKHDRLSKYKAEKAESKAAKKQKRIDENVSKWAEAVPEWLDQDVMKKDLEESANMLIDAGYTKEELSEFYDYRLMGVLRKAAMFDKMKKSDVSSKKVKTPPKSLSGGAKNITANPREEFERKKSALKSSGKLKDAQEALKLML